MDQSRALIGTPPYPQASWIVGVLAGKTLTRAAQGMAYLGHELREVGVDHGHHYKHAGRSISPPAEAIKVEVAELNKGGAQNVKRATDRRMIRSIHQVHEERRDGPRRSRKGILYRSELSSSSHVSCIAPTVSPRSRPYPHVVVFS